MKKLIAAALTGALVLGTVGTSVVFAADDDKLMKKEKIAYRNCSCTP